MGARSVSGYGYACHGLYLPWLHFLGLHFLWLRFLWLRFLWLHLLWLDHLGHPAVTLGRRVDEGRVVVQAGVDLDYLAWARAQLGEGSSTIVRGGGVLCGL